MSPDIPPLHFPGFEMQRAQPLQTRSDSDQVEGREKGVGSDRWCSVGYFLNTPRGGRSV